MVANIGRDELRAKMDRGDPFILLEVLALSITGTLTCPER